MLGRAEQLQQAGGGSSTRRSGVLAYRPWTYKGYSLVGLGSGDPSAVLDAGSAAASGQTWALGLIDTHHSQGKALGPPSYSDLWL